MKFRFPAFLLALSVVAAGPLVAADSVDQVLAKARAYLGSDRALDAVQSVHFTGTIAVDANTKLPVDIIFKKPYQQRITVTGPKVIEVTALDDYDAWQKRTNPANATQWQVTLLDASQVKRLRANTWENLYFFIGIEKKGGRVQPGADATVDGIACAKVSFVHADNIIFARYFDKATGRLVKTETENGGEIREEGRIDAGGIRFPRSVINKAPDGTSTTIVFDKIEVNAPVAADAFAVPAFQAN